MSYSKERMDKKIYKQYLERIVKHLEARGYTVNLNSNTFAFVDEDNTILCPSKSHGTYSMICGLLHEAGHTKQPPSVFKGLRKSLKRDQLIIAEQEYTAWSLGLELADKLDILDPILYREYIKEWSKYWHSYLNSLFKDGNPRLIEEIMSAYRDI